MDYVFTDLGTSGQKILASVEGMYRSHLVESGARPIKMLLDYELEEEKAVEYPFGVGVVEVFGQTWRVGTKPIVCHTNRVKSESLVPKVLATLGSLYGDRSATCHLVVLLPLDQYASRRVVGGYLREVLNGKSSYNGKLVNVQVDKIFFHPEGAGLNAPSQGSHAALMLGHTDFTIARFDEGRFNLTESQTFGKKGLGKIVKSLGIPGYDAEIISAIVRGKFNEIQIPGVPEEHIRDTINRAVETYRGEVLAEALGSYDWRGISSIVLGGGTSRYLRKAIAEIVPVRKVSLAKVPKGLRLFGTKDSLRYGDVFGIACRYLSDEIEEKLSEPDMWKQEPVSVPVEVMS